MRISIATRAGLLAVFGVLSQQAQSQSLSESDFQLLLDTLSVQADVPKKLVMFGVPTAGVASNGRFFGSITMVNPRGGRDNAGADFDTAFGFGFGDPNDYVGAQFTVHITGTDPFGDAGYFGAKFGRRLIGGETPTSVSLSIGKIAPWGNIGVTSETSYTLIATHINSLNLGGANYPFLITGGYGNQTEAGNPGAFVGLGVGLTSYLGLSVSGNAEQINAGLGVSFPEIDGLNLSVGFNDISDDGGRRQFSISASYSFQSPF